jgi:hypothetical protein
MIFDPIPKSYHRNIRFCVPNGQCPRVTQPPIEDSPFRAPKSAPCGLRAAGCLAPTSVAGCTANIAEAVRQWYRRADSKAPVVTLSTDARFLMRSDAFASLPNCCFNEDISFRTVRSYNRRFDSAGA